MHSTTSDRPRLLDANVLIALAVYEHEHHHRVSVWAAQEPPMVVCPIVEGSLVRFLVRSGISVRTAVAVLEGIESSGLCDFWPDDVSYRSVGLTHVVGHRQVTDAYLASLAISHGGVLATLDEALARTLPEATELIPVG